jgi:hypothetical protein
LKALMKIAAPKTLRMRDKVHLNDPVSLKTRLAWDPGVKQVGGSALGATVGAGAGLVADLATMNPTFASTHAGAAAGSVLGGMVGQQLARKQLKPVLEATEYGQKLPGKKKQLQKAARLATPHEKEKARRYRASHKTEIARKAKIRQIKTKAGAHLPRKRMGTAAGGYSFGAPVRKSSRARSYRTIGSGGNASGLNFNPYKMPHGTDRLERIAKVAAKKKPQPGFRAAMLELKHRGHGGPVKDPPKGDPSLNSFRLSKGTSRELPLR